jgi:hypothetical protein
LTFGHFIAKLKAVLHSGALWSDMIKCPINSERVILKSCIRIISISHSALRLYDVSFSAFSVFMDIIHVYLDPIHVLIY